MSERIDPPEMSQRELDEYLDRLMREGREDSPEFRRAFKVGRRTREGSACGAGAFRSQWNY